jgi:hypothetical protein
VAVLESNTELRVDQRGGKITGKFNDYGFTGSKTGLTSPLVVQKTNTFENRLTPAATIGMAPEVHLTFVNRTP